MNTLSDDDLQARLLDGVSRTFALTIPQLPKPLARVVANAYLLCRIIDTIEDEVNLTSRQKREFCKSFVEVTSAMQRPETFSHELAPMLSEHTLPAEHELISCVPRVIAITRSFDAVQRNALVTCVETMARGMTEFQDRDLRYGLNSLTEMNHYCYFVAGVVGEMLTRLFCHYSTEIAAHRLTLMELSVSFGQAIMAFSSLSSGGSAEASGKPPPSCWRGVASGC
jgi:farnesyl-diphosphate farnesyltransferase